MVELNLIRPAEAFVVFDGVNPVLIPTTANMSGIIIESLATLTPGKTVIITAELAADIVRTVTTGATAGDPITTVTTDVASSGILFTRRTVPGTLTVATNTAKVTFTNPNIASSLQPGDAISVTGDGGTLQPIMYVQSISGADALLGYSSAPAQSAVPVNIHILGDVKKDKMIVDGKITIAGKNSYFEASLPAEYIAKQITIHDGVLKGVKLLILTESPLQKMITIDRVDTATGKYYFDAIGTGLSTGDIIKGQIYFNPGFTHVAPSIHWISIYSNVFIPADAVQPGVARITVKTVAT